jgi:bifunctional non-homologous end joining protein LigD
VSDLAEYRRKRSADRTPEPFPSDRDGASGRPIFVVQRHLARRAHYDLRLERDGALASWAVPKGIPLEPGTRALAVHVEDHPMEYATFEGEIPAGEYGAGKVEIWDAGTYEMVHERPDGSLTVRLDGDRLRGTWALAPAGLGGDPKNWLLIRKREEDGRVWSDERYPPMLATLGKDPPAGPAWRHEVKWDGFRTLVRLRGGEPTLWSRRDQDLGERFAAVARRLPRAVGTPDCVLDGEVCALGPDGVPRFALLQRGEGDLVYYVFDLLELEGEPLLERPWRERRARLAEVIEPDDPVVRISGDFPDGRALLEAARTQGLEGIIAKRVEAPYRPGARSRDWVKVKARLRQEFVIAGYRRGQGSRSHLGSLILAVHEGARLVGVGNVGSGFTEAEIDRLLARLAPLERPDSPLDGHAPAPRNRASEPVWVEPALVCEVEFAEWTRDGVLRAPVYIGLREDTPPEEVVREREGRSSEPSQPPAPTRDLRLTNLDKVFFPEEGITKGDLIEYYRAVAPVLVPHLRERPFTMIRFPDGITGQHFFQKDRPDHTPDWIEVAPFHASSDAESRLIRFPIVNDADALLWMVNMGCIDMNAWYSRRTSPANPDFVLFDLDPAEGSGFGEATRVALLVKEVLDLMGLRGYPKTSSARGLHVMVPIEPVHTYEEVRRFCAVVAAALEGTHRGLVTTRWAKAGRRGVLIDSNQIGYAKTISSVYSVRPRPGAPVSTPLRWDEVDPELDPRELTMKAVLDRVERSGDLFAPVLEGGQEIGAALSRLSG